MSIRLDFSSGTVKTDLANLPQKMLEYAEEALLKQAELMRDLAKINCPIDTGSLRDSIRVERGGEGLKWRQIRVRAGGYVTNPETGKKVDYAIYQEFGTKYISAKLFMTSAYLEVLPTIAEMIKANVVQNI